MALDPNERYQSATELAGALSAAGWPSRRLLPDPGPPLFDEVPPDAQCERLRRGEPPLGGAAQPGGATP